MARTWTDRAACRQDDPTSYFEECVTARGLSCGRCPVRRSCLDEAMAAEGSVVASMRFGVFGGLTSTQRAELARTGTARPQQHGGGRPLARCGTDSAYNRHVRKGEPIDDGCRAAHAAQARSRTLAGGAKARG